MPIQTFQDFTEGEGPGPRQEEDCLICMDPINAFKKTVTHTDPNPIPCHVTLCRACFMEWAIQNAEVRKCPSCRAPLQVNMDEAAMIADIGTDGRHDGSFWPRISNIDAFAVGRVDREVVQRAYALQGQAVDFGEYDRAFFLERAIICPSVKSFLDNVLERGGYHHSRSPIFPNVLPTLFTYIRYSASVSVNFVRWLHADRQELRPTFVRWALRNEALLDPAAQPLSHLVHRGLFNTTNGRWPVNIDRFKIFHYYDSYYLVPETMPSMRTPLEQYFWNIGDFVKSKGWMQVREDLSTTPSIDRTHQMRYYDPPYVIILAEVGIAIPSLPKGRFLPWQLENGEIWPSPEEPEPRRRIDLWEDVYAEDVLRKLHTRSGMPACPRGLVEAFMAEALQFEEDTRRAAFATLGMQPPDVAPVHGPHPRPRPQ